MIKETIVVEGKDDISNVKSAVDCEVIATGGYYFSKKFIHELKNIQRRNGIIIFTDPDYAGNRIRQKIKESIPDAKEAFLDRQSALKNGDVGVENASKEDIIRALKEARCERIDRIEEFKIDDLLRNNLINSNDAKERRIMLCKNLSIGYCNGKQLLNRLNAFMIKREEFEKALKNI